MSNNELEELRNEFRSLTVEEFADAMGIERWQVYQMISAAKKDPTKAPPHLKVGRSYRFPIAAARKWYAEQTLGNFSRPMSKTLYEHGGTANQKGITSSE